MKILVLSSLVPVEDQKFYDSSSKGMIANSSNAFQQGLFLSPVLSRENEVTIFTCPAIGSYPRLFTKIFSKESYHESEGVRIYSVRFFNFTVLKQISISLKLMSSIFRYSLRGERGDVVICYSLLPSYTSVAMFLKKTILKKSKFIFIVPDLPKFFDAPSKSILKKILQKINIIVADYFSGAADGYIFFSVQMSMEKKFKNKPYIVMEGIYNPIEADLDKFELDLYKKFENLTQGCRTILYTGSIDLRFGLGDLVSAFARIEQKDIRLVVCGSGSGLSEFLKLIEKNKRIIYCGAVSRAMSLVMQKKATVLVNPRRADEEYTKYSFPSKTLEYLASSRPVVMYLLPGMPIEYVKYINTPADGSIDSLASKLAEVALDTGGEFLDRAISAAEFIKNNKTSNAQSSKIETFIRGLVNNGGEIL